jgi:hypothetical protein
LSDYGQVTSSSFPGHIRSATKGMIAQNRAIDFRITHLTGENLQPVITYKK